MKKSTNGSKWNSLTTGHAAYPSALPVQHQQEFRRAVGLLRVRTRHGAMTPPPQGEMEELAEALGTA
jgi:hypothetical protein